LEADAMRFEALIAGGIALHDAHADLPKHRMKRYIPRDLSAICRIYVHHSGALGRSGLEGAKASAAYDIREHDWPGAAYHYWIPAESMIDDQGRLCVLRMQRDNVHSYHTGWLANHHGIGVCLQGNTTEDPLTTSHVECLEALLPWLRERYDLGGEWLSMHSESGRWGGHAKPSCPGNNAEAWIRAYRGDESTT
jgi:hypothetical protein